MGRLVYSAIGSLDGFVEDASGGFEWAAPDDEVHAFVNEMERGIGTYLYGRGMYETMVAWETLESEDPVAQEFASACGAPRRRSCSHGRCPRCPAPGRGSSGRSTSLLSGS